MTDASTPALLTPAAVSSAAHPAAHERPVRPSPAVASPAVREVAWRQAAALVARRLGHVKAAPGRLVGIILNPLVLLLAIGYLFVGALRGADGGTPYVDYLAAGVAAQAALAGVGPTAVSVRLDLDRGFMDRLRSLPIRDGVVHLAHSVADLLISLAAIGVVLTVSLLMGWRPIADAGGILAGLGLLALFAYATVWIGIALGSVVRNAESVDAMAALLLVVLTFLSSALLAPSALPAWLQPVVEWNPVSAVATAVRTVWGDPVPAPAGFAGEHPLALALGWSVALIVASVVVTRTAGRRP